jgi:homoserine dehydrogenase
MVGFGNVGKAFARLLLDKEAELLEKYQLKLVVTGICTRSHGAAINPQGLDLQAVLDALRAGGLLSGLDTAGFSGSALDFIAACEGDVLLESTPVNPGRVSQQSRTWKPACARACTLSPRIKARSCLGTSS